MSINTKWWALAATE